MRFNSCSMRRQRPVPTALAGGVASAALVLTAAAWAGTSAVIPDHVGTARALVNGLCVQDNAGNAYSYALPPAITWGPTKFVNSSDCSSFVSGLLEHTYGLSAANVEALAGTTKATGTIKAWPQSATWYAAVGNGTTGTCMPAVTGAASLQIGDFIFSKYNTGDSSGDTGHCMLVDTAPAAMLSTAAPVIAGTTEWSLEVIDVTGSPHTNDTRYHTNAAGDGSNAAGAGMGMIRIYVNADGTTNSWSWGTGSTSSLYSMAARPLVFGRPNKAALTALAAGGTVQPAAKVAVSK